MDSTAAIRARSQRQAMDWSLVLASQGIAATIMPPGEEHGWELLVDAPEYTRALQTIRQYHVENRGQVWAHTLPGTGLVFDWSSTLWMLLLALVYGLDKMSHGHLRATGMMDSVAVWSGEWWRLFTAVMLHADLAHLAANVTTGLLLLGLAMGSSGAGCGFAAAYLAGVCGNLAGLMIYPLPHLGLGASGMVLGALGVLTAQSLAYWRAGGASRQLIVRGLLGGVLLLVLLGLNPNPRSDVVAHVAGFVTGVTLGGVLIAVPARVRQSGGANLAAAVVCTGLMVLTWGLALR